MRPGGGHNIIMISLFHDLFQIQLALLLKHLRYLLNSTFFCYNICPPCGLVDKAPASRLSGSGFEAGRLHVVWPAMIYSASWQLAREGHARPGRTVPPSTCGTLNFRLKLAPMNRARKGRVVGPWCLCNKHCLAGKRAQSHPLNHSN